MITLILIQVGVASFPLSFLRLFIVFVVCVRVCAGTAPCLRLCSSRKRRHLFKWKLIGFYYQSLSHTSVSDLIKPTVARVIAH